jgi:peptide/nickel transport system permease protein
LHVRQHLTSVYAAGDAATYTGKLQLITIWMVTLFIFLLLRMTGNPIEILVPPDTLLEDRQRLMVLYGLDKPVWQQYLTFVKGVFAGNFGVSLRWADQGAFDVVMKRLPATLQLSGTAFIFSVVLGVGGSDR